MHRHHYLGFLINNSAFECESDLHNAESTYFNILDSTVKDCSSVSEIAIFNVHHYLNNVGAYQTFNNAISNSHLIKKSRYGNDGAIYCKSNNLSVDKSNFTNNKDSSKVIVEGYDIFYSYNSSLSISESSSLNYLTNSRYMTFNNTTVLFKSEFKGNANIINATYDRITPKAMSFNNMDYYSINTHVKFVSGECIELKQISGLTSQ